MAVVNNHISVKKCVICKHWQGNALIRLEKHKYYYESSVVGRCRIENWSRKSFESCPKYEPIYQLS